jgi:hypothetical protein
MRATDEIYLTRQEVITLDTKTNGAAKTIEKIQIGFEYMKAMAENKFKRNLEYNSKVEVLKKNITILSYQIKLVKHVTEDKA